MSDGGELSGWYIGEALLASVTLISLAWRTERRGRTITNEQWSIERLTFLGVSFAVASFHVLFAIHVGHASFGQIESVQTDSLIRGIVSLMPAAALIFADVALVMLVMVAREIRVVDRVRYLAVRYRLDEGKINDGFERFDLRYFPFIELEKHVAKNATLSDPDSIAAEAQKYIDELFATLGKEDPSPDEKQASLLLWSELSAFENENLLYDITFDEFARVCLPRPKNQ